MSAIYPCNLLPALVFSAGIISSVNAQTTLVLAPNHDTQVGYHDNFNSANTNYNSTPYCSAFSQPGAAGGVNTSRTLLQFDLSSIPVNATVLGAFLTLSASGPTGIGDVGQVGSTGQNASKLYRITSSWNDNTVTWNTQPSFTTMNAAPLAQSTYSLENYININVTALVQDMVADPANSFGFLLKVDNETPSRGLCFYGGLVSQQDKRPQLVVIYGDCGQIGIDEVSGDDGNLRLTPNMTSPGSTIELNLGGKFSGNANVLLYDALGQIVLTRIVSAWPFSMTVPGMAPGTYSWKVVNQAGNPLGSARMVVQ
jgi:hypothetical protein